jgi:two-component system, cell cycle response regulator
MGDRIGHRDDTEPQSASEQTDPAGAAVRDNRDSLTPVNPPPAVPFPGHEIPDPIPSRPTEDTFPVSLPPVCDRPTLTMITGSEAGSIHVVSKDETKIGRSRESHVRVDDLGTSRTHARITRDENGAYVLEDRGSRHGTTVHGERIVRHTLADGDRIGLGPNVFMRFSFTDRTEEEMLRRRYESSVLDALTGTLNRGHFIDRLDAEIAYARRHGTPLSLLLFDVDEFKNINDTLGHQAGDHALGSLCAIVRSSLRLEDIFARYGGEEFAVVARGIGIDEAMKAAERVRALVEVADIVYQGALIRLTISVGVASLDCCDGDANAREELIRIADARMYSAKRAGRNRCAGRPHA